jgi:hypothetical protein
MACTGQVASQVLQRMQISVELLDDSRVSHVHALVSSVPLQEGPCASPFLTRPVCLLRQNARTRSPPAGG